MQEQQAAEQPTMGELYGSARTHEPDLEWNYVVKGFFRRGETSLLYGPSNCGKSALVVLLGSAVASGQPFAGQRTKQGLVVHVAAEAASSILDRTAALPELKDEGCAPYAVRRRGLDLREAAEVDGLIDEVRRIEKKHGHAAALIILDTLVLCIGSGDENSSSDMTRAIEGAKRLANKLDAHVMLVHHTGKDAERGSRGTSALQGNVDTEVALIPGSEGIVRIHTTKQRDMVKPGDLAFRTRAFHLGEDEDGDPRTTARAVLVDAPVDTGPAPKSLGDRRVAVLTTLHLWRLTHVGNAEPRPFSTKDVVESLPEEVLTGVRPENRSRVVGKLLVEISEESGAVLSKSGEGWILSRASVPGSTNPV